MSGYRLTRRIQNSENARSVNNFLWTMSQFMTPGSYQDRSVGGEMWQFPYLNWSSFCRFPLIYGWHVFVIDSMHGLGNACSLVGTCTSPLKRFCRGQHRMMKGDWTCGADNVMTSGSVHCRVPSFASKASTPLRSTSLC